MSPWFTHAYLQHWNEMAVDDASYASMLKESLFVSSNTLASPCEMKDERNQTDNSKLHLYLHINLELIWLLLLACS